MLMELKENMLRILHIRRLRQFPGQQLWPAVRMRNILRIRAVEGMQFFGRGK